MINPPPIFTFQEIKEIVSGIQAKNAKLLAFPVDIESFADIELGILVDEMQGLAENSIISSAIIDNFTRIVIDSRIFNSDKDASRFYLAHEVGHYFLHREHFEKQRNTMSPDEWMYFASASLNYKDVENNANTFARLLLIPSEKLIECINKMPRPSIPELTRQFGVKQWVIEKRVQDPDILPFLNIN